MFGAQQGAGQYVDTCSNCGAKVIDPHAKFCSSCAQPVHGHQVHPYSASPVIYPQGQGGVYIDNPSAPYMNKQPPQYVSGQAPQTQAPPAYSSQFATEAQYSVQ